MNRMPLKAFWDAVEQQSAVCAETPRARGKDKEASAVLNEVRNRFPRVSSRRHHFHRELNAAVQKMERSLR